jgi:hypothetical protein
MKRTLSTGGFGRSATLDSDLSGGAGKMAMIYLPLPTDENSKYIQKLLKEQEDAMADYEEEMQQNIEAFKRPKAFSLVDPTMKHENKIM